MKTGRNDPCPCGSGRKYKACCLNDVQPSLSTRAAQVRRTQADLEPRLLTWARSELGDEAVHAAMVDFTLGRHVIEPPGAEEQLFVPWLLYSWRPRPPTSPMRSADRDDAPSIAEAYFHSRGAQLSASERDFLRAVFEEPFSFYDIEGCKPGQSLLLRDILRGVRREAIEVSGSQGPRPGDIFFCRVVPFEDVNLIIGSGSIVMNPRCKEPILELRGTLKEELGDIGPEVLQILDDQLREMYFIIRAKLLNPPTPKLCNSDGDPLLFHEITYEIQSPEDAFQALSPLAMHHTPEELRRNAQLDGAGRVKEAKFTWMRSGSKLNPALENTILGSISIDGLRLTVEVNSERRAKRIMAEIRKRLKGDATHLKTTARSAEALLRAPKRGSNRKERESHEEESRRLMESPEVQAKIHSILEAHWSTWPEQPLPALKGKTPLDAVKDPEGREMVDSLLAMAERQEQERPQAGAPFDFTPIRQRLGLAPTRHSTT